MKDPQGSRGWAAVMVAAILMTLAAAIAASAQDAVTFKTLHSFNLNDGSLPFPSLMQASSGALYGTTEEGGASGSSGTIFRIDPVTGKLISVYSFCSQNGCTDGSLPLGQLTQDDEGNLFGTTFEGGAYGNGTVFKINRSGALTTLHSFNYSDGAKPDAGVVLGFDGNFYGVTNYGGAWNGGAIFKITPSGTLTTLYSFCNVTGCPVGEDPTGLIQGSDGNLYGTTTNGGARGGGTVFKITTAGTLTTLHNFCSMASCKDGADPLAGLVEGSDGDFYGTTQFGGGNTTCHIGSGCGVVFKVTSTGTLTTLHSFCSLSGCSDGYFPVSVLIQATDGNFYGTTNDGGTANVCASCGTVFSITSDGDLTTLHTFHGFDGDNPIGGVIQDTNGTFYGTTTSGGSGTACDNSGCGTVFSLSLGLGPFVSANPPFGNVGKHVTILGTNLTGATSVTFNGTSATFTVSGSGTSVTATVPSGATTGPVQVVTPSGTLTSNVNFQILP